MINLSGYKLTFDDEFNGFSGNGPSNYQVTGHTGTWDTTYSYGERKLNDEVQMYSDSTVGVNPFSTSGGVLDIHAAPSADPSKTQGQTYTSGAITTFHSFAQQYGYFEMRAELPAGTGMWPAFWMLPVEHVWPPELDVLEAFGATNANGEGGAYSIHSGPITTGVGGLGGWNDTNGANLYSQYNTFGVDWQADKMTFYFNGQSYASMATPSDFNQPMYLLANLAVGGHWAGAPAGQSGDLKIDYIRAFSKDGYNPAVAQGTISSPDGKGYDFYGAVDVNGNGALGAVVKSAAAQTIGSGSDDLVLQMSEDAYQGDAQFTVTVDGKQVGGTLTASASHGAGQSQTFHVLGSYAAGTHKVGINFLNDSYGGSAGADRNLFLDSASINGAAVSGGHLEEYSGGLQSFSFTVASSSAAVQGTSQPAPSTSTGSTSATGPDTFVFKVSEDAYQGDAQYSIAINGTTIGGTRTVTASHAAGKSETVTVNGTFGAGATARIMFLNDAYGGTASTDRNLYVSGVTYNGLATGPDQAVLLSNGPADFKPASNVSLLLAEDAYQGDAKFSVWVDGKQVVNGGVCTASAAAGKTQGVTLPGILAAGTHDIAVGFLNDAYGGTDSTDRNLYVMGANVQGKAVSGFGGALYSEGTQHFNLLVPA